MISDAASFLAALRDRLADEAGGEASVTHPVVIGEMYEEATALLLGSAAAFDGLGLTIATGFVEDATGTPSKQVDCMVCVGEGRQLGQSRHRVFSLADVLMVVEVKKTLRARELKSSLSWFRDFHSRLSWPDHSRSPRLVQKAWTSLTPNRGRRIERKCWHTPLSRELS